MVNNYRYNQELNHKVKSIHFEGNIFKINSKKKRSYFTLVAQLLSPQYFLLLNLKICHTAIDKTINKLRLDELLSLHGKRKKLEHIKHNKSEPVIENKRSIPYPTRTLDPKITLVDRALEIQNASQSIQSHTDGKLKIILKQIQNLQNEAREILEKSQRDMELHRISCNFEKRPGLNLHLYERPNSEKYFSMLSPEEWGNPPHLFLGSYTLNLDGSFVRTDIDD